MAEKSHETLVDTQFGAQASAYLHSDVHSQGSDLQVLAALVSGKREARVLDLGCGGGHVSFHVAPEVGEVVAYDLSADMLAAVEAEAARRGLGNLVTRRGAAEDLPFAAGSFDAVFSRFSAHHWWDFDAGLREAARVLKSGGAAAFIDSICPGVPLFDTYLQSVELLRDPSHVRSYSRAEWEEMLARAGLAPRAASRHRVRLAFDVWIERMQTPKVQADAIRALQAKMSDSVACYFAVEADGTFQIELAVFEAGKTG